MGQGPARGIGEDEPFIIEGVEFVPAWARSSQPGSFTLQKAGRMVESYRELVSGYHHPRMVELGIFQGGSVAMLTLLARPSRLVAIEFSDQPIEALAAFIAERRLDGVVRPHYGVDQADRPRLEAIVAQDLGDDPIDLVIDDASHRYAETVASFEVLFPRLAPGGSYVIEDWTCDDTTAAAMARALADPDSEVGAKLRAAFEDATDQFTSERMARVVPLSRLAAELVLARAVSGEAVADVKVDEDWITVVRGPGTLDPSTFRLRDLVPDHFGLLAPVPEDLLAVRPAPRAAGASPTWFTPDS
jgi:cephalosporin hydroxylase